MINKKNKKIKSCAGSKKLGYICISEDNFLSDKLEQI